MSEKDYKGAAHDLNNILTSILNNIYYLKEVTGLPESTNRTILNLEKDAKRAADIIATTFLDKGQNTKKELQKVLLDEVADEVITSLHSGLRENIELLSDHQPSLPPIIADRTDIYRIIFNLVKNAIEAIPNKGSVNIITEYSEEKIKVKIKDDGEGIKPEHLDKIFDYKFSTKDKDTESGYGLSIVKEKVKSYDGNISVDSSDKGTVFELIFPAFVKETKSRVKILIAEDDLSVLEVLSDLLESYNYIVTKTTNGIDLIEMASEGTFDLLLVDNKLPGKDGLESIKEIRSRNISSTIILASGSDIDQNDESIKELRIDKVIRKPYSFPEIINSIRKLV